MPLVSLKIAARELGYSNVKSIRRLHARGLLKIIRIPGEVIDTLRVDTAEIERIKRGDVKAANTRKNSGTERSSPQSRSRRRRHSGGIDGSPHLTLPSTPRKVRHYA